MSQPRTEVLASVLSLFVIVLACSGARAQPPWAGAGGRSGADRTIFHFLLDHRAEIGRIVKQLPNGVETLTEADDPATVAKLKEHVRAMHGRLEESRPIHMRDPLFAEIFRNADRIDVVIEETANGVRVRQTSDDPYVVKLIQAHANVLSRFIAVGYPEVRANHPLP